MFRNLALVTLYLSARCVSFRRMPNDVSYIWNSIALKAERTSSNKRVDLSSLEIEDALNVVYPKISFCGIFQLIQVLSHSLPITASKVYTNYGYSFDSKLVQLLTVLPSLPSPFLNWCTKHDLSPRDLFPLLSLTAPLEIENHLQKISELAVSRNLGAQILELLVECYLMSSQDLANQDLTNSAEDWLSQLKRARYPQTQNSDSEKQKRMMALPWPKDFQLRWQRNGDRGGLEVKFFVTNEQELLKFSKLLEQTMQTTKRLLQQTEPLDERLHQQAEPLHERLLQQTEILTETNNETA